MISSMLCVKIQVAKKGGKSINEHPTYISNQQAFATQIQTAKGKKRHFVDIGCVGKCLVSIREKHNQKLANITNNKVKSRLQTIWSNRTKS